MSDKFLFSLNCLAFLSGVHSLDSNILFHLLDFIFLGFILISMTRASALLKINFLFASLFENASLDLIFLGVCDGADGEAQFLTSWVDSQSDSHHPDGPDGGG